MSKRGMAESGADESRECKGCGKKFSSNNSRSAGNDNQSHYCPACTLAATSFKEHQRIGPYIIDSLLGEGGMGEVFLAFHEITGRAVALKVPLNRGNQPHSALLKRFDQEMHVLSLLDHPGILPIYEVGNDKNTRQPWFAMKLAEGGTLADQLREGQAMPPQQAAQIMAELASAVQHAHDHGILHRDLKPQNIFMDEAGHPMLGDFGLAKPTNERFDLSRTMAALGTPGYAAPEISQGQAPSVAADIFSMGAILYHLLAGHPPFNGESLTSVLDMAREGKAVPLIRKDVPMDLWHVCQKCLEPEPAYRYVTVKMLEDDLRSWLAGQGVSVRKLSPLTKLSRLVRRNPLVTMLALTTAVTVSLSLGIVLVSYERLLSAAQIKNEAEESMAVEKRHQERVEHIQLLLEHNRAGHRTEALQLLQDEWAIKPGPFLRSLAIKALTRGEFVKEGGEGATVHANYSSSDRAMKHSSSTSGRMAVSGGPYNRQLKILNKEGLLEAEFTMEDAVTALQWNKAGDRLAIGSMAKDTLLWKAAYSQSPPERHVRPRESASRKFVWHPTELLIACVTEEGGLYLWDLERRHDLCMYSYGIPEKSVLSWGKGATSLEWKDEQGQPQHVGVMVPEGVRMLRHGGMGGKRETFSSMDINADRQQVLWVTDEGVRLWHWGQHQHQIIVPKFGSEWMGARFSKDTVQSCGWSSGLRGISEQEWTAGKTLPSIGGSAPFVGAVLIAASASEPAWLGLLERPYNRFLLAHPGQSRQAKILNHKNPYDLAFTHDGERAATSSFNDETILLWDLKKADNKPQGSFSAGANATNLYFSPDGKIIAGSNSRGITLWDASSGEVKLNIHAGEPSQMLAWSPDGQMLAAQSLSGTRLYRAADGQFIAELTSPVSSPGDRFVSLTFDRHQPVLAEQLEDGAVIVWDLNEIKKSLEQIGIDWPDK